jgi:hypothetical protein
MKMFNVTGSISRLGGGVAPVVKQLSKYQQELSCKVIVGCRLDCYTSKDIPANIRYEVFAEPASRLSLPGGSRKLNKRLANSINEIDIVHCHAL